MKKILFLHGFYASGQCVPAIALKEALKDKVEVLTPDLPPGGHTPTAEEVHKYYVPLIEKMTNKLKEMEAEYEEKEKGFCKKNR